MIVIGVDVHKHSLTAAAVDGLGRVLAEWSGPVEGEVVPAACTVKFRVRFPAYRFRL